MSDKDVQSGPSEEVPCSAHPDAPHGFNRNASHTEDRYVCDCEGWNPPAGARDAVTDQFVAECGEEYFCVKRMSWDQKSMRAAIEYALTGKADARDDIHTCNYYCTRPACIRAQRDELVAAMEATQPAATGMGEGYVPCDGEVLVTVSGLTGTGKSAIAMEVEILCQALGLQVEWKDGAPERNMTHGDSAEALELYKPRVTIIEQNIPRPKA